MARNVRSPGSSRRPQSQETDIGRPDNPVISTREVEDIEERSSPRTPIIYEVVRRLGEEEMARPAVSLWWSGLAGGLSISFSLLAQAIIDIHLPDAGWRPLVSSFGYSVGFLMVVLSRQQLFTENTITVVLPVMADFSMANVVRLGRMWSIVLVANIIGTLVASLFCALTPVLAPEIRAGMIDISSHLLALGWADMFFRAITAGFLIAAMVWLIPSADAAQFHIVTLMTYLIAAGGFVHIVAGSVEAFTLVVDGKLSVGAMFSHFMLPVLLGNIIGGTALFAMISYAQVMREI
jgi:formate-nitrite transporter family protein